MYSLKFYHRKFVPAQAGGNYICGKLKEKQDLLLEQSGSPVLKTGLYGIQNRHAKFKENVIETYVSQQTERWVNNEL